MPSKIQLDENLWFLYICLQKSDLKSIDFAAVGQSTKLKPPAARMRYTRLRRQIESGTLIGTHGTPFLSSQPSTSHSISNEKKRKRVGGESTKGDGDEEEDIGWGKKVEGVKVESEVKGKGVVKEEEESDDGFETDTGSGSEGWDSEDEVPLAKLRKARLSTKPGLAHPPPPPPSQHSQRPSGNYGYGYGSGIRGGNAAGSGGGTGYEGAVPRYIEASEGTAWKGMIPTGNVGIQSAGYPAYWGNGFSGVGAWDQGGKPRKSV